MNHRKEDNYVPIEKFFNKTSIYKNKNELIVKNRKCIATLGIHNNLYKIINQNNF